MNLIFELKRKLFHIFILIIPAAFLILGKTTFLKIILPISAVIISLDRLRLKNAKINTVIVKIFGPIMRQKEIESQSLSGMSYMLAAACLSFAFFKKEFAITGFFILSISDALAAIIGKKFYSDPFFEKSIAGSSAFFISGFFIVITCAVAFNCAWWFYIFGIFALFCVTMFEARPNLIKIDDNFSIPFGFAAIVTIFDILLNYKF